MYTCVHAYVMCICNNVICACTNAYMLTAPLRRHPPKTRYAGLGTTCNLTACLLGPCVIWDQDRPYSSPSHTQSPATPQIKTLHSQKAHFATRMPALQPPEIHLLERPLCHPHSSLVEYRIMPLAFSDTDKIPCEEMTVMFEVWRASRKDAFTRGRMTKILAGLME